MFSMAFVLETLAYAVLSLSAIFPKCGFFFPINWTTTLTHHFQLFHIFPSSVCITHTPDTLLVSVLLSFPGNLISFYHSHWLLPMFFLNSACIADLRAIDSLTNTEVSASCFKKSYGLDTRTEKKLRRQAFPFVAFPKKTTV